MEAPRNTSAADAARKGKAHTMAYTARLSGTCYACNGAITPGQSITHRRGKAAQGEGNYRHATCPEGNGEGRDEAPGHGDVTIEDDAPTTRPATAPAASGGSIDAMLADLMWGRIEPRIAAAVEQAAGALDVDTIRRTIVEEIARAREPRAVTVAVVRPDGERIPLGLTHRQVATDLLPALRAGLSPYLYGAPGAGKSHAAKQAADALGLPFYMISLGAQTPAWRLEGFVDAHGVIHDSDFAKAYADGGVFLIDEGDNASSNLLTTLNAATANGRAAFARGVIERHADFRLIVTGNTSGSGAHPAFPERRPFDAAFRDRLFYIAWHYDVALERKLAHAAAGEQTDVAEAWLTWVHAVRAYVEQHKGRTLATPRAIVEGVKALLVGFTPERAADGLVFRGCPDDERSKILAACPLPKVRVRQAEAA
jgi:hypothetical protein